MSEDNELYFKATVDPKLVSLQDDALQFIITTILKHEGEFYQLVEKNFKNDLEQILCTTDNTIIEMITEITNKFFNQLYLDIQNTLENPLTALVWKMVEKAEYGPHILLDKLLRFTFDAHIEINREQLSTKDLDTYLKTVLCQINLYLQTHRLVYILSKQPGDDIPFVPVPSEQQPFQIIIDKKLMD